MDIEARALDNLISGLKSKYGDNSFISGDTLKKQEISIDCIPTGSLLLDSQIGIGGIPCGRITEIWGSEGSGKTTIATLIMKNAQEKWPKQCVGFIDVEHAYNLPYAEQLGLNPDTMYFSQPGSGEEALDTLIEAAGSGAFSVLVLDSVAGLKTKAQLAKGVGEDTMGQVAKLMSENLSKIATNAKRTNTAVIFINQIRSKMTMYGDPNVTMGGNALKFWASLRLEIKRGGQASIIKDGDIPIGQIIKVILRKNKVGYPFGEIETNLLFGHGFDPYEELATLAIDKGIIEKKGAWFYYEEEKYQGKANLIVALKAEQEFNDTVLSKIFP